MRKDTDVASSAAPSWRVTASTDDTGLASSAASSSRRRGRSGPAVASTATGYGPTARPGEDAAAQRSTGIVGRMPHRPVEPAEAPGAGPAELGPVPEEVLRLGRRRFNAGVRLGMTALAAELGVNRVTLYRWVGSRERLLVEVMWSLAARALVLAGSQSPAAAGDRAVRVLVRFLELVLAHPGMQQLLTTDIDLAMRLLTHRAAGFQPRLLDAVEELLREERAALRLEVPMDDRELAYVVVRLIESYTYLDVLLGEEPEAARAEAALRLLLRSPD